MLISSNHFYLNLGKQILNSLQNMMKEHGIFEKTHKQKCSVITRCLTYLLSKIRYTTQLIVTFKKLSPIHTNWELTMQLITIFM